MQLPRPSDHPNVAAGATGATGAAALYGILREIDSRWIMYIAIGAFFLASLLATYLFLLLRRRSWRGDPERHYPPDTAPGAHLAALDAARAGEVVNFIAGTLIALAGTALAVYFAATSAGLFTPILIGTLTVLLAGFYFFSSHSLELHRRRLEAHEIHRLAMLDFLRFFDPHGPPELGKAREQILANTTALAPVPETTRSGGLRRKDLKAAIEIIRVAAGLKTDSGQRSD
jgi:hypothetical protein